jgi:transcription elongation factor GreB
MSRAFVKEPEPDAPGDDLPDRSISEHPNYVTPGGLRQLEDKIAALEEQRRDVVELGDDPVAAERLRHLDRDLRYFRRRLESAILVDPASQPAHEVAFGAAVTTADERGDMRTFTIVGEDESDLATLKVGYVSPLAQALLGAHEGESVPWRRPAGDLTLTVTAIAYGERS